MGSGVVRILALVVGVLVGQSAWAAVDLSVVGLVNRGLKAEEDFGGGITQGPGVGFGGGVLAEVSVGEKMGIEVGALYDLVRIIDTNAGVESSQKIHLLVIPALFRYWLTPSVAVAAGGFYVTSLEGCGCDDYGYALSARYSLPVGTSVSLIADGRFNGGFKEEEDGKAITREAMLLLGASFRL